MSAKYRQRTSLLVAFLLALSACSGGRSTEAFCQSVSDGKAEILDELESDQAAAQELAASGDAIGGALVAVVSSVEAITALEAYFADLAQAAPPEIQAEAELTSEIVSGMAENFKTDSAISALAGTAIDSFRLNSPLSSMNGFAVTHCGEGV